MSIRAAKAKRWRIGQACSAALYRCVADHGERIFAEIVHGTATVRWRSQHMISRGPDNALKLRALAARFRGHAAETGVDYFRRKFESTASELEEAAVDAETRKRPDLKQVS